MDYHTIAKLYMMRIKAVLGIEKIDHLTKKKQALWGDRIYKFSREHHNTTIKNHEIYILMEKDIKRAMEDDLSETRLYSKFLVKLLPGMPDQLPEADNGSTGL